MTKQGYYQGLLKTPNQHCSKALLLSFIHKKALLYQLISINEAAKHVCSKKIHSCTSDLCYSLKWR